MCLDKRVLVGLGAVAVGVWLWGPPWAVAGLPFLAVLVCPLSMLVLVRPGDGTQCQTLTPAARESLSDKREAELTRLREEINVLKAQQDTTRSRADKGESS
ncbi:MAG: hypothetical protein ACRDQF_10955 [Thermocrispum sp.]